jgi:hypothetical protein
MRPCDCSHVILTQAFDTISPPPLSSPLPLRPETPWQAQADHAAAMAATKARMGVWLSTTLAKFDGLRPPPPPPGSAAAGAAPLPPEDPAFAAALLESLPHVRSWFERAAASMERQVRTETCLRRRWGGASVLATLACRCLSVCRQWTQPLLRSLPGSQPLKPRKLRSQKPPALLPQLRQLPSVAPPL